MYTTYFGFAEPPFSLTPDPRYLYMSERHREGLAHLLYGVRQPGGFVQLTGEVGSGKTTLCRCLVTQLPPATDVALVLNPRLSVLELLAAVCDELRVPYATGTRSIKVLVDALNRHLLEAHTQGRRTVLIIDEAQNLRFDVLEQIRLLTNLETASEKLLQIILIGQPELITILEREKVRQLAQRITARYHLLPLSARETSAYIRHRLRVAGGNKALFTAAAMRCIHRLSGGIPRLINVLCDRALLGAYAVDAHQVDAAIVRQAGREVRGSFPRRRSFRPAWTAGVAALGILAAWGLFYATPVRMSEPQRDERPVAATADTRPSPTPPRLTDLLADPSVKTNDQASFASLFSRWGVDPQKISGRLGCDAENSQGLECVSQVGNWTRLRRFDLPVLLDLRTLGGERHRVALVGLGEQTASLELGGRAYTFPLPEIEKLWDGSFILLWKPPPHGVRLLSPGMRGQDVAWVRQTLESLDGKVPQSTVSGVYDAGLEQRVLAFQRSRSLVPDGFVGKETLLQLTLAARGPATPSLVRQAP
jgi:general secretion pathway protein A